MVAPYVSDIVRSEKTEAPDNIQNRMVVNRPVSRRKNIITGIILSGWIVSVLLIMSVVASSVYLLVTQPSVPLPDTLREWAGIAMGFLFGNFFNIVRDYLTTEKDNG